MDGEAALQSCVALKGRYKATRKREFKLLWREAGPPNHLGFGPVGCQSRSVCLAWQVTVGVRQSDGSFERTDFKFGPEDAGSLNVACLPVFKTPPGLSRAQLHPGKPANLSESCNGNHYTKALIS